MHSICYTDPAIMLDSPLKENKKKKHSNDQVNVRLTKEMLADIDEIVKEERYNNRSELIRQAVREWLNDKKEKREHPKEREATVKSGRS
jgi:Arc/MetJ-type ribon-helix-helix transcriptional regulator